jgi:uncharacterized protein YjbJ (UPF0337 family)
MIGSRPYFVSALPFVIPRTGSICRLIIEPSPCRVRLLPNIYPTFSLCALAHRLSEAPSLISPSQLPDRIFGTDALNKFHSKEHTMNKDQAKGRIEEAKGKVKEVAGNLVGNDDLELKGKIQKSGGKVQAAYGDLKQDVKDASKGK